MSSTMHLLRHIWTNKDICFIFFLVFKDKLFVIVLTYVFTCICRPVDKYVYQQHPFGQTADVCLRVSKAGAQMWSKCNNWKRPMRCPFQGQLLIGNCQLVDMLDQYHQLWGATKCFVLKNPFHIFSPGQLSLSRSTSEVKPPRPECKMPVTISPPNLSSICIQAPCLKQPSPGLEFSPYLWKLDSRPYPKPSVSLSSWGLA